MIKKMEITKNKQRVELEYSTTPFLCEGEVEARYLSGEDEIFYNRKLQAVAALDVSLLIWGDGQLDLPTIRNDKFANIYVSEALSPGGHWNATKKEELRKIGVSPSDNPNASGRNHDNLSLEIIARMKEALPNYSSSLDVRIHSAQFLHTIGLSYETDLARFYIDQIVNRALEDARKLLYGN